MNLQEKPTTPRPGVSLPLWVPGLIPVIITAILYIPVLTNGFVNWDDDVYILNNPHLQSLTASNLTWMFTDFFAGFVIPLYWLSLALDHWIAGPSPWIYHLDNLLLHCANTFLVFVVSLKILGLGIEKAGKPVLSPGETVRMTWSALGTALIFGIHPLHVESVAWAAERKDLLCGFFFLLAIGAYLSYAASPRPDRKKYWASLLLFLAALLSKPMAISFPLILLLLDFWPLQLRDRAQAFWEKAPFFTLSALAGISVVYYQFHSGQGIGLNQLPMDFRIMNSFHSAILYLWKLLVPTGLCTFYPIFTDRTYSPEYWTTALLFLGLTWAGFRARKKYPYGLVAWLYFLVTLIPVLGLVQNNSVAHADRYTYLPTLAPILLLCGSLAVLFKRAKWGTCAIVLVWLAALGALTHAQIGHWSDSIHLWENVVRVEPTNNPMVYTNLGYSYQQAGRLDEALAEYDRAISIGVPVANPHCGKGNIYFEKGDLAKAEQEYDAAIAIDSRYAQPHSDLAMVYLKEGKADEAVQECLKALRLDPKFEPAYGNLGTIYLSQGKYADAVRSFENGLKLNPDDASLKEGLMKAEQKSSPSGI